MRVARKALATVVKPGEDEDEDEEGDEDALDDENVVEGEAELVADEAELPVAGVEQVNGEEETVNPGAAEEPAPPGRS